MTLPSPFALGAFWGFSELCLNLLKRSRSNAVSKDRNSITLIWVVNLASVGIGVFLAFHLRSWSLPWRSQFYIAGFSLYVCGLIIRWGSIIYLGRFFTVNVAIAADHQLIQSGPYRFVRHPSYTGGLLMLLGFCLSIGNLASLVIMVVPCVGVCLWRIHVEEEALIQAFGERYQDYVKRTKRLIPFVY